MAGSGSPELPRTQTHRVTLRSVSAVAALASAPRQWSRKILQSTPPPLPLISLPPDDDWEEFDVPAKTGFAYALPDLLLENEETQDASDTPVPSPSTNGARRPHFPHDRAGICRTLSEYMAQNEAFQVRRHGFGIDTTLVYKRTKSSTTAKSPLPGVPSNATDVDNLAFDAFFESGNLDRAYRVLGRHYATPRELLGRGHSTSTAAASAGASSAGGWSSPFPFFVKVDMEYDLYCDADVSTHGHIQWYFFRVAVPLACLHRSSPLQSLRVRFNIRNMLKKASLYNDGMLPAVYVDGPHGRGWHHAGVNVCYFKNADTYRHRKTAKLTNFYTLSFVYEFQAPAQTPSPVVVYFAHCYPYSYSRLQRYLLTLQKDPDRSRFLRRRVLCKTLAGNICDVLTITNFAQEDDARTGVILTARVHPGESNASFIMHGLLDFLTGPSCEARYLRHRFVFKVVPMLNPDGVIHGNYRCSLAGTDLNRRYVEPSPDLHPTVHATKAMVLSMRKTRVVSLYCDIHGHSRKKNMFLYGCVPFDDADGAANPRAEAARLRLFPHVLSKTCSFYCLPDCTFSVSKSKRGTGRVVVWQEAHVLHSFTLEASFFGVGVNKKRPALGTNQQPSSAGSENGVDTAMTHFMPHDLRAAGTSLCLSLIPFSQFLDRDRPTPPPPVLPSNHEGEQRPSGSAERTFSPVQAVPTGPAHTVAFASRSSASPGPLGSPRGRLAPLPLPHASASLAGAVSTPFLLPRSPLATVASAASPRQLYQFPAAAAAPVLPFASFFRMDSLLTSLPSTDDLLREIEATLPEDFAQYDDNDDDGESVGSESDPSGDNMEAEELQRHESWANLLKDTSSSVQDAPPPAKLTKNRSQSLLKRFSDSTLRLAIAPDIPPTAQPADPAPEQASGSAMPTRSATPVQHAKVKAVVAPPPVRTPSSSSTLVRRIPMNAPQTHGHPRDRNTEIAALHLRAVQRRSRAKRTNHRHVINEQELL